MRRWLVVVGGYGLVLVVNACVGDSTTPPIDASNDTTLDDSSAPDVVDATNNDATDAATGAINGTVVAIDGTPIAAAKVEINGQVMKPDANGHFTLPDPGPTYTATFSFTQGTFNVKTFMVYQGLTRRDPTLVMPVRFLASSTNVTGVVNGAASGLSAGRIAFAPKGAIGVNASNSISVSADGGLGTSPVFFPSTSQTGELIFFQRTFDDAGLVTGYPAVAIDSNIGVAANGSLSETFDASPPTGTGAISGAVNTPTTGGWVVDLTGLQAIFNGTTPVLLESTTSSAFDFLAPNINGVKLMINAKATSATGESSTAWKTGLTVNTSGVALALPAAPIVASPAQSAVVALSTAAFTYNKVQGVAFATFECESPDAGADAGNGGVDYFVHVITTSTSVVAPQDAALSLALPPSGSSCLFDVGSMSGYTTVDATADTGGYANSFSADFAVVDGSYVVSAPLTVTAQ